MTEIYEGDSATLDLSGGKVDVTDPCYERGTWCAKWEMPVKPGVYDVTQSLADCGEWGTRVAALTIEHRDAVPQSVWMLYSGDIGVDAGLCGFFADKPDFEDDAWMDICHMMHDIDEMAGHYHSLYTFIRNGVFSATGYGDGGYDLYCRTDAAGDIVALRVVYITEEDDEEEEEEDDEEEDEDL